MTVHVRRQYEDVGDWWDDHGYEPDPPPAPEPDRCPRHGWLLTNTGDCGECLERQHDQREAARWRKASDHADRRDAAWEAHYEHAENHD